MHLICEHFELTQYIAVFQIWYCTCIATENATHQEATEHMSTLWYLVNLFIFLALCILGYQLIIFILAPLVIFYICRYLSQHQGDPICVNCEVYPFHRVSWCHHVGWFHPWLPLPWLHPCVCWPGYIFGLLAEPVLWWALWPKLEKQKKCDRVFTH